MTRRVLHVVPNSDGSNESKCNLTQHGDLGDTFFRTKQEALRFAQEELSSQIVIHGKDGRIQKEYTYGLDPEKTKG